MAEENSDGSDIMTMEDLSKTLTATVATVGKMSETVSNLATDFGEVKKSMEASSKSRTFSATGMHDKDRDKKMEKEASTAHAMIAQMSEAIFKAAAEKDEGKRMEAIQQVMGSDDITRKVASLESAVQDQQVIIKAQNLELSRPRVEFLEKAFEEAGAPHDRISTMRASWEQMPLDALDEEIERVQILQSNAIYGTTMQRAAAPEYNRRPPVDPTNAGFSPPGAGAGAAAGPVPPLRIPPAAARRNRQAAGTNATLKADAGEDAQSLFMTPFSARHQ